jgi:hypothetical protein
LVYPFEKWKRGDQADQRGESKPMAKVTPETVVQALRVLAEIPDPSSLHSRSISTLTDRFPEIAAVFKDQTAGRSLLDLNFIGLKARRLLQQIKEEQQ